MTSPASIVSKFSVALLPFLLSACIEFDFPSGPGSLRGSPYLQGSTSGARYEGFLTYSDRREIEKAAWTAAGSETSHTVYNWQNPATQSSGSVQSGVVYLVGFNAGREIEAPVGLDISNMLEPSAGNFQTNANTNVRLAPEIRGDKSMLLQQGTIVQAIAFEPVQRWYLVAQNNRVIGYIFADLLNKTGGGDLLLAGGEAQVPKICRELTYKMFYKTGSQDEWLNGACREGRKSWAIVGGRALEAAS